MLSLFEPKRGRVLSIGGLLVAAGLLYLASHLSRTAEAQTPNQLAPPSKPEPPPPPPLGPPPIASPDVPVRPPEPERGTAAAPSARPTPTLRGLGIDQLVDHLNDLRAKRAELDRQEKETVAALREKLKEQRQKLQQLGIALEEPAPLP